MSCEDSDVPMISKDCNIEAFLKAIEEMDLWEIISFADREATSAWQRAYRRHKGRDAHSELEDRYEHALEELISFLRTALPYRPFKLDEAVFKNFVQIRQKVFHEERGLFRK